MSNRPTPLTPQTGISIDREGTTSLQKLDYAVATDALNSVRSVSGIAGCEISASTDLEAMNKWIEHCKKGIRPLSPHTITNYLKEGQRFIDWLVDRELSLREMLIEDAEAYIAYLQSPPASDIGVRRPRNSEDWKPFAKALNPPAVKQAVVIVNSMCRYLLNVGYLAKNPFRTCTRSSRNDTNAASRAMSSEMLLAMLDTAKWQETSLLERSKTPKTAILYCARSRWLITLLFFVGARIQEIADGKMSDFTFRSGVWLLRIVGKGAKTRLVSAPDALIEELRRYRLSVGVPALPGPTDSLPLVSSVRLGLENGLTTRQLYNLVRKLAESTTERIAAEQPHLAEQLKLISPHWFRHGNAYARVRQGQSMRDIAEELGHASMNTTKIYVDDRPEERAKKHRGFKLPVAD